MDIKLYVGNMAYNTTEDDLRGLFSQAGIVTSVALIKDRTTGMSKGFAFVEMDSRDNAQKAITMFNEGFQPRNKKRKRDGNRRRY